VSFDAVDERLLEEDQSVWELFHENSKMSRYERHPTFPFHPSDAQVVRVMRSLRTVKRYTDFPKVALPRELAPADKSFDDLVLERRTARSFGSGAISLPALAKILYFSYGITADNAETDFPRPFRAVPSGGALFPLELYLHATRVQGLESGLYHFDPEDMTLDVLRRGDEIDRLAPILVQADLARQAAALVLVTAVFYRSTFKYGDRGYRFVLIEAGHLAENAVLAAGSTGLASASIGGFADREVDRYLGIDGLSESTVYALLLGRPGSTAERAAGIAG
jgi:SagB-type dehydrogenase family enzyme